MLPFDTTGLERVNSIVWSSWGRNTSGHINLIPAFPLATKLIINYHSVIIRPMTYYRVIIGRLMALGLLSV